MLTPGEANPFGGIKDGENRQFQHNKTAKKLAESVAAQREAMQQVEDPNSEEYKQTQALLEEYKAKRGPSLLDVHQSNKSQKTGTFKSFINIAYITYIIHDKHYIRIYIAYIV